MDWQTDILVIGTGIAGCSAALAAARNGASVLLITGSNELLDSNTAYAQGGIVTRGVNDSPSQLAEDILQAGAGLCHPAAVQFLAENGPAIVDRLLVKELGVEFSKGPDGIFDITEEAAHSMPRILHADDLTGRAIIVRLLDAVRAESRITVKTGCLAVDLLNVSDHSGNRLDIYRPPACVGAYVFETATGEIHTVTAQETILATGGLGQIYLHTSNPTVARGDGIALAYRIGARLLNLEYIQFHPTTLYHRDADSYLLTESMRGEGARLVNARGEEFMKTIHPLGSLAPRDIVARGILNEMLRSGRPCVYLDITHKDAEWTRNRFPNIYQTCKQFHIDITSDLIPVVPAEHYSCGGVAADLNGCTSIARLRAVGEVSCTGLHGANRLASTSLLEGLLWGWQAGSKASETALSKASRIEIPPIRPFVAQSEPVDPALIVQDWLSIQYTMWNYVGLSRTVRRMERAMSILRELQREIFVFYRKARPGESVLSLRNGITTALAVLFAAQRNHSSCGCHHLQED
jgi:L-aspartate oxidase